MIINELYIRILRILRTLRYLRYLRTEHLEQPLKANGPCKCVKNGLASGFWDCPRSLPQARHLRLCNHDGKVRQGTSESRSPKSTLDFTDVANNLATKPRRNISYEIVATGYFRWLFVFGCISSWGK